MLMKSYALKLKQKQYEKPISDFMKRLEDRLGKKLVSCVLFGSVARGRAKEHSDIDLLIVADDIPEFKYRSSLISTDVFEILMKHKIAISTILMEPKEIVSSVNSKFPLLLGIVLGYKILYDKDRFFQEQMAILKKSLKKENASYENGVWTVPCHILQKTEVSA